MDFYNTHMLLMAVQSLDKPASFLRDRYFPTNPNTDVFATNDVLVEYRDGSKRLAPFVAPRKGGVTILRNGSTMRRYEPPYIAPRRMLTSDDLEKRGFGEALMSKLTPEDRQRILLLRDAEELSNMISRREEAMAAEVMQTNGCIMRHIADDVDEGDDKEIHFYDGDTSQAVYTPSGKWTAEYTGIIADLTAMTRMLTTRGLPATELLVAPDVADAIINNPSIRQLLDIRNYEMGSVAAQPLPAGAARVAKLNANGRMIDVICYEETYTDDKGKVQQYIKPGHAILTAPAAGRTVYGAVTQVEQKDGQFHTYTGARVPKYLSSAESNTRTLTMTSCPLLMPNHKDAFIVAKVLGE